MNKNKIYIVVGIVLVLLTAVFWWEDSRELDDVKQIKKESLIPRRQKMGNIRVLIKTNGFLETTHQSVQLRSKSGMRMQHGEQEFTINPQETVTLKPDDERFKEGSIKVQCLAEDDKIEILSLERGYGTPSYRGEIEMFTTAEGIALVNELPVEEYLYAVVPSEMPSYYELEALKAQAVCARSYAYNQSRSYSYPQYNAHVDDSTTFQVYGNSKESESTNRAVRETAGELLWFRGTVATAYYYSTSCGKSADISAWGGAITDENSYLQSVVLCDESGEDYEKALPWYRWHITVPEQILENQIELYAKKEIGKLLSIEISERGVGGIVQEIKAVGTSGAIVVSTENKIRQALGGTGCTIYKHDGSESVCGKLLPSAFFEIQKTDGTYQIQGGGYGHGIGMSQNGANEMAKRGKNYIEILCTFYSGISVK